MENKKEKKESRNFRPLALFIVVIIALSTTIGYGIRPQPVFNLTCPESVYNLSCPEIPEPVCNTDCPTYTEQPLFMREAGNVADAHYWGDARYMCCDFSTELFNRLESDGYGDVRICEGRALWCDPATDNYDCRHCWVKIGESVVIETTTGEIVAPKDYREKYYERRCYGYVPDHIKSWISSY